MRSLVGGSRMALARCILAGVRAASLISLREDFVLAIFEKSLHNSVNFQPQEVVNISMKSYRRQLQSHVVFRP